MEGTGWGRGKKGPLARKPLDFEKRPLVFTVELIYRLTTLSPSYSATCTQYNSATCIDLHTRMEGNKSNVCL